MISYKQEILRKLIHLSSLWMVFVMYYIPREKAIMIFLYLLIAISMVEYLRKKSQLFKKYFIKFFGSMLRDNELNKNHMMGATSFIIAAFICVLFFSKEIAILAFSTMIISDTAAALIGRKFGSMEIIPGKSYMGAVAFFISALLTMMGLSLFLFNAKFSLMAISLAALVGTFAEIIAKQSRVDDNILIPLSIAIFLAQQI